jgi:hypothetical protein
MEFQRKYLRLSVDRLIIALTMCALGILINPSRAQSACVPGKVPARTRFPVVMKGPPQLAGTSVTALQAWSFRDGKWTRVPIQVDEVNIEGNYVLEEGLPYTKFTDDGLLDALDEISVKGAELGEEPPASGKLKTPPGFIQGVPVRVCDSDGRWYGSLVIGTFSAGAPAGGWSPLFDRTKMEVATRSYRYQFRKDQPMLMGRVFLKDHGDDVSLFESNSFVMPIVPRWGFLPTLYFGEEDFTSEIECWRSGPVRSIVAVGSRLRKFFSIVNLHLFSELVFYDDYFQIPTKIEFIFDPSKFLGKGTGLGYVLGFPKDISWDLRSNLAPLPPRGVEDPSLNTRAIDSSENGRFAVTGYSRLGSFKAHVRVDPKALSQTPPPYLLEKDAFNNESIRKHWAWVRKVNGQLGVFIEISGVKQGLYDFALDVAMSNQAHDDFADFRTMTAYWSGDAAL